MKKRIKDIHAVKDLPRGSGNRVADGARLFDPADDSHVSKATPLETKMKEFAASKAELGTELASDTNKTRERRTTAKRRDKDTRPL